MWTSCILLDLFVLVFLRVTNTDPCSVTVRDKRCKRHANVDINGVTVSYWITDPEAKSSKQTSK